MTQRLSSAEQKLRAVRQTSAGWFARQGAVGPRIFEFLVFTIKQGWACLFAGLMCALLVATSIFYPEGAIIARYDFLMVAAIVIQVILLLTGMETWEEAKVVLAYHIIGTAMEIFKTQAGSWVYPEESLLRIGNVPLFSGFMYAALGSYIARSWRLFNFQFSDYPRADFTVALAIAIYLNFFSHHFVPDIRYGLFAITALLFLRTRVHFQIDQIHRHMPLLVGFFIIALFIWVGENIGTYTNAWAYPSQENGWQMAPASKLGSWYLLIVISFVLVSLIYPIKSKNTAAPDKEGKKQKSETQIRKIL